MNGPDPLTVRNARLFGGELVDITLRDGLIAQLGAAGSFQLSGEEVDARGRFVGPGLWDAHVHFTQWAITQRRVDLTGIRSAEEVIATVQRAVAAGFPLTDGVLMGYGYRDGLWPSPTTLRALDAAFGALPVVLINSDLHSAWMNSSGAARLQLSPGATGVVSEYDWIAALQRFQHSIVIPIEAYREMADQAAARGVVGIVDYENDANVDLWPERVAQGVRQLRVEGAIWPDTLEEAVAAGLRSGEVLDPEGLVRVGSLKAVVDGSLNTRTAWCWDPYPGLDPALPHACGVESLPMSELRPLLERARAAGIGAAVHAIGDRANSQVIDVFESLGMPGIIEHAQLLREEDIGRLARAGLIASVQPEQAMDDRDIADHHWAGRTGRAFAFASLHRAGVPLRLGSDAPVAPLDPWLALASATTRSRGERAAWHPEQKLPLGVALAASTRSRVEVGQPADLVLVDRDPYACDRDELRGMPVAATLLGGRFTHRDL